MSGLIIGTLLTLFFGVAFYLRVVLPYDVVFSGERIKLTGMDAYWQMRIVDSWFVISLPALTLSIGSPTRPEVYYSLLASLPQKSL